MKRKVKYVISAVIGVILLLPSMLPEAAMSLLRMKVAGQSIREMTLLTAVMYAVKVIMKRRKKVMKMIEVIKRNKITILGYLMTVLIDISVVLLTMTTLKYPMMAEAVFGPLGLVREGAANEGAIYGLVTGVLSAITGVSVYATSKPGWESKEKYEERVQEDEKEQVKKRFIKLVLKRIARYQKEADGKETYKEKYPEGVSVEKKEKEILDALYLKIIEEYRKDEYMEIIQKELGRLKIKEEEHQSGEVKKNIRW